MDRVRKLAIQQLKIPHPISFIFHFTELHIVTVTSLSQGIIVKKSSLLLFIIFKIKKCYITYIYIYISVYRCRPTTSAEQFN